MKFQRNSFLEASLLESLYSGPHRFGIGAHMEHQKFVGKVISVTFGEESYLSMKMEARGVCNGMVAIKTNNLRLIVVA